MFAEKSNKIRAKLQLNFSWRHSTWMRKVRKYNDQWNWYLNGPHFGPKMPQIWPKNQNFQKTEKTPQGIHLSYTCPKFQTYLTIYPFPRAPRRFSVHLVSRTGSPGPKIRIFKNWKKHVQGFTQAMRVPNARQIWPFMPSLYHPEGFWSI